MTFVVVLVAVAVVFVVLAVVLILGLRSVFSGDRNHQGEP